MSYKVSNHQNSWLRGQGNESLKNNLNERLPSMNFKYFETGMVFFFKCLRTSQDWAGELISINRVPMRVYMFLAVQEKKKD